MSEHNNDGELYQASTRLNSKLSSIDNNNIIQVSLSNYIDSQNRLKLVENLLDNRNKLINRLVNCLENVILKNNEYELAKEQYEKEIEQIKIDLAQVKRDIGISSKNYDDLNQYTFKLKKENEELRVILNEYKITNEVTRTTCSQYAQRELLEQTMQTTQEKIKCMRFELKNLKEFLKETFQNSKKIIFSFQKANEKLYKENLNLKLKCELNSASYSNSRSDRNMNIDDCNFVEIQTNSLCDGSRELNSSIDLKSLHWMDDVVEKEKEQESLNANQTRSIEYEIEQLYNYFQLEFYNSSNNNNNNRVNSSSRSRTGSDSINLINMTSSSLINNLTSLLRILITKCISLNEKFEILEIIYDMLSKFNETNSNHCYCQPASQSDKLASLI